MVAFLRVELNVVPSYVSHMKKFIKAVREFFRPRKPWAQEAFEAFELHMKQVQAEHAQEAAFDAMLLASMAEEETILSSRPISNILPSSRTLH
jgi:bifunctional DNase/RNase